PCVAYQTGLPMVRQVCVPFVVALMGMMFQVINTKSHRAWCEIWKISDYRHHFVPARAPENQIMGRIMNDDVVRMIAERTDAEGDQQAHPPIAETQMAHPERECGLHYDNRDRDQCSPRIAHH